MDAGISAKLASVRSNLKAVRDGVLPNEPITNYAFPDQVTISGWLNRFETLRRENLIEEVTQLLSEIDLPSTIGDEARYDHLSLYHRISQVREQAREILSTAMSLGYPHTLNVIARTNEIAPDLNDIAGALDRIQASIDLVQKQTLPNVSDGVAITVGPISVTLGSLRRAVSTAREKIHLDEPDTNISALIIALSKIADISDQISKQLSEIILKIPRQVRLAFNEIIRSVYDVADRGIELLRTIRSRNAKKETDAEQSEHNGSNRGVSPNYSLAEIGAHLRNVRQSKNLDIEDISQSTRIYPAYIRFIEDGQFDQTPGRTYAIGYVKTYSQYLGINSEPLLESLRELLPHDWYRFHDWYQGSDKLIGYSDYLKHPPPGKTR